MKPSYGLPLLLMAHNVHHRQVDGFAHPMFQSYHTYPIAHDENARYDPRGSTTLDHSDPQSTPNRWENEGPAEAFSSSVVPQQKLQALQHQVDSLLHDNSRLEDQLRALENDYVVDVTALADRLEHLLDHRSPDRRFGLQVETSPSFRRLTRNDDGEEVISPRPLVEFHVNNGEDEEEDDEEEEEDDVDVDFEHAARVEQSLLTLSTRGMLRAQQASLRARFRQLTDGVRSTFRGETSPNAGGSSGGDEVVRVTIEECTDPYDD